MSFEKLGLMAELVKAVALKGYTEPTPIQSQSIPVILKGGDLMGGAQTGTGKTAAFTLPILQLLTENASSHARNGKQSWPRALIITPTRELAAQIGESVNAYGRGLDTTSTVIFGGVGINPQTARLRRGVDIVVATPGRLLDHANQRNINLSKIDILVLDEATANIDSYTERIIQDALKKLLEGRTALVIAHRLSTIRNSDRIIVVRDGEIIESGTHDNLVSANGLYAQLWQTNYTSFDDIAGNADDVTGIPATTT